MAKSISEFQDAFIALLKEAEQELGATLEVNITSSEVIDLEYSISSSYPLTPKTRKYFCRISTNN